jgi:hypothetical protein
MPKFAVSYWYGNEESPRETQIVEAANEVVALILANNVSFSPAYWADQENCWTRIQFLSREEKEVNEKLSCFE